MVRSNTLVFCIVILTMAATYCTGWSKQQDNLGINLLMERRLAKREFQDQLFGKVDASRRLLRAVVPVRHPIDDPEPGDDDPDDDPVPRRRPAPKAPCPCPCGSGSYTICPPGCEKGSCECPCPCGYRGYVYCPTGCYPRISCSVL